MSPKSRRSAKQRKRDVSAENAAAVADAVDAVADAGSEPDDADDARELPPLDTPRPRRPSTDAPVPSQPLPTATALGGSRARTFTRLGILAAIAAIVVFAITESSLLKWQQQLSAALFAFAEVLFALRDPRVRGWLKHVSIDQWRAIDAETVRDPSAAGRVDWKVLVILVTVAVCLTLQEYIGSHDTYERWFPYNGQQYWELYGFAWWSGWRLLGYVLIPMAVLAFLPGERIRDYHVSPRGFFKHLWIYVVMFICIMPAVFLASTTQAFRHTYPFYRMANRSYTDLVCWELLYAAQFMSLEFFFRGFILQGLRRALGANALFVMLVPYCMIHYGKPMPETLGAIGAGLILGTLAMRTRSIWGGVMIHIGVATTMDVLAMRACAPMGSGKFCHNR